MQKDNFRFHFTIFIVYGKSSLCQWQTYHRWDFNIHVDDNDDDNVKKFLDQMYSLELTQHATYPTHDKDHILDLIITKTEDTCMTGIDYDWLHLSDHC